MGSETQPPSVIGVCASAGGVDALERLFRRLPPDTGLGFVVLTHLAPNRQSLLPEIVAGFTAMTVAPACDGGRIGRNTVYVPPENTLLEVEGGVLRLRAVPGGETGAQLSALARTGKPGAVGTEGGRTDLVDPAGSGDHRRLWRLDEELQMANSELSHKLDILGQANSDLNNLIDATEIATLVFDRNLTLCTFTPPAASIFKLVPGDRGRPLTDFIGRLDYPGLQADAEATLRTGEPLETLADGTDGASQFLVRLRSFSGLGAGARGLIITFIDVTRAAEAEAHQRVLIAELNHRVKNLLTVVIGVARQTCRGALSADQYAADLISRLESMARSYELLSRENWKAARIDELARQLLDLVGPGRVRLEGPELTLRPKQALSIGMILHELATNAVKYGALSVPEGRIALTWTVTEGEGGPKLHLTWSEEDGPALTPPRTTGFGLKLLDRETSHGLGGEATTTWRPSGLRVDLRAGVTP